MEWSIYNHLYYSKISKSYLLYSSLSNMIIELDKDGYDEMCRIKSNVNSVDSDDKEYNFLFDGRFIVESNSNEINKIIASTLLKRYDPSNLSLTIAPTQACNFGCSYCYESNRINKSMSIDVQNKIIDFVKSFKHVNNVNIIWYGGEPTLEIDRIRYLTSEIKKTDKQINAYMVTNGYHLDKVVEHITELCITGIQITLDGTGETHNKTRHLLNGGATFDKIISNIELLLTKHDISVAVRMNISKGNSDQFAPLFKLLSDRFQNKVNLYPAFVADYTKSCKSGSCYEKSHEKATYLKQLFLKDNLYCKSLYPTRIAKGCMSQQLYSFVIGPSGELYKCWHNIGNESKVIGNVFEQSVIVNYAVFADMLVKNDCLFDDKCKKCVLFPSCYGGCVDDKNLGMDYCNPAKSMLEDFIDMRYLYKQTKIEK